MVKEVHAAHILVKTEEEAKTLRQQILTGASFETVAMQHSLCPSKKKGGDLGWFGRGRMVRAFELAAFALKRGDLSLPIKTEFGWHLIRCLETR